MTVEHLDEAIDSGPSVFGSLVFWLIIVRLMIFHPFSLFSPLTSLKSRLSSSCLASDEDDVSLFPGSPGGVVPLSFVMLAAVVVVWSTSLLVCWLGGEGF